MYKITFKKVKGLWFLMLNNRRQSDYIVFQDSYDFDYGHSHTHPTDNIVYWKTLSAAKKALVEVFIHDEMLELRNK